MADKTSGSFSTGEVKQVVFEMAHNKAAGPDGFPMELYRLFWEVIKNDLVAPVVDFQQGKLDISRLYYGIVSLIPRCKDPADVRKFRPISPRR